MSDLMQQRVTNIVTVARALRASRPECYDDIGGCMLCQSDDPDACINLARVAINALAADGATGNPPKVREQ